MRKTVIIEYACVFESYKAHRMLEKLTGRKIKRDHMMGSLKFELPEEYVDFLMNKVDFFTIEKDSEHTRNISRIDFEDSNGDSSI